MERNVKVRETGQNVHVQQILWEIRTKKDVGRLKSVGLTEIVQLLHVVPLSMVQGSV